MNATAAAAVTGNRDAGALREEACAYLALRRRWRGSPEFYARERLGMTPTWQQREILAALAPEGAKVSVRSGHSIGKSAALAAVLWWFLETRDYARVPCTAPTAHQLHDVLWAEAAKWARRADQLSARRGDARRFWLGSLFRSTRDRICDFGAPEEWFAVARTSGRDNPDALQGFHASDLEIEAGGRETKARETTTDDSLILFLIDEASGIYDKVFEVAEGALASPGARLLMTGNPTRLKGYFAESQRSARGQFTTLHFRSEDSPLADAGYRARLVARFGEGSNVVRVRADGEFPEEEDDTLIALAWAEAATEREPAEQGTGIPRRLGIDVARFGNDRIAFLLRVGRTVEASMVLQKADTMEIVGAAAEFTRQNRADEIYIDTSGGLGAGVADRLRELGLPAVDVEFGAAAPKRATGEERPPLKLMRDYIWWEMREWLRTEEPSLSLLPRETREDLAGELATPSYGYDSSGRLRLESKDTMRKHGTGRSPDLADALACTFAPIAPRAARVYSAGRRSFSPPTERMMP